MKKRVCFLLPVLFIVVVGITLSIKQSVNIILKGTTRGVTTDASGRFTFNDVPDNGVLVFSYTGFVSQEISVKGNTTIKCIY